MYIFDEIDPPLSDEDECDRDELPDGYLRPPVELTEGSYVIGGGGLASGNAVPFPPPSRWRLLPELSDAAAQTSDEILVRAAVKRYRVVRGERAGNISAVWADALAQLAVTGRRAYDEFVASRPQEATLIGVARRRLNDESDAIVNEDDLSHSVGYVLDVAYKTAWSLRASPSVRNRLRAEQGWIACCSEVDSPHRPLNVPTAPYPQYDMHVTVTGTRFTCRYFIAAYSTAPEGPDFPGTGRREMPPEPEPWLPEDERILLFLHGHGSRAEEALALIPHIHRIGAERGERFAVVSVDLPSRGYSTMLDHEVVAPFPATFGHRVPHRPPGLRYPILEFMENFIARFLAELARQLGRPLDDVTIIGGSLGGNLSLRLNNPVLRANLSGDLTPVNTWIRRHVAWSPASVWTSYGLSNDFFKDESIRMTRDKSRQPEALDDRIKFIDEVFYEVPGEALRWIFGILTLGVFNLALNLPAPSQTWYRDDWSPCKDLAIDGGVYEIAEVYSQLYRRWHWRVAFEQLLFSHAEDIPGPATGALYMLMTRPLLLLSGAADNYDYAHIFDRSREMARALPGLTGKGVFLRDTGHSIHAERPRFLATQIVDFVLDN